MMKKFFSLMLIAASLFAVSCDKDDDDNKSDDKETYVGTMSIALTYYSQTLDLVQEDITYYFEEENDLATVTLSQVQFTVGLAAAINALGIPSLSMDEDPYMPALDIVLPNIPETTTDDLYEAASVTPTSLYGDPYDDSIIRSITNVSVEEIDATVDQLSVSFDCELTLSLGDVTATISFVGDEVE